MMRVSTTIRIVVGLAMLTLSTMLVGRSLNIGPNPDRARLEGRARLCETLAVSSSLFLTRGDMQALRNCLDAAIKRNPDVQAATLRRIDGTVFVQLGTAVGPAGQTEQSAASKVEIDLLEGEHSWGRLEIHFAPQETGLLALWREPMTQFVAFVAAGCFFSFFLFLRKTLQHLNPSKVIPGRVRDALDALAGGLIILDNKERIVLANKTISEALGTKPEKLQGCPASQLPWESSSVLDHEQEFPWTRAIRDGKRLKGETLSLRGCSDDLNSFVISCAPILGSNGKLRGALTSFEDVTELEKKKSELREMLTVLQESREQIRKKNEELQFLATRDPLTFCLNRRSFYEKMESLWDHASERNQQLGCVMLDIDHFKSINDNHGHSTGDVVLKRIGSTLKDAVREGDVLCRYGGEEFCILMPDLDIDESAQAAEHFRQAVESMEIPELKVTSSFGVTAISLGASSPQNLLDEADKCLYVAKRNGRNQVARWDSVPADMDFTEKIGREAPTDAAASSAGANAAPSEDEQAIPFHAVTALISALSYRDESTAAHSRRVADLCVAVADGMMSVEDSYVLEVAALLHDIGKIGVPDSILLKPGPLTSEEWKVMGIHDRIGVEIIGSTFTNETLLEIVENHHAFYGGLSRHEDLPTGHDIPLRARILSIADAYDAMVSDRVYRKGMPQEDAFAELRRCAGSQFDPELVPRFIEVVHARDESRKQDSFQVSKEVAMQLGENMERLAHAIDHQDFHGLATIAGRVKATATKQGVLEVADVAGQLQLAAEQMDVAQSVFLTNELLDLCRSIQSVHLKRVDVEEAEQEVLEVCLLAETN